MNTDNDWVSRAVAVAALVLSLFTLWHTSFRVFNRLEARLVGGHVQQADSMVNDSVVLEVAFVNSGNRDITIRQPHVEISDRPLRTTELSIAVDRPLPLILPPQKFEVLRIKFPVRTITFKYAQNANLISERTDLPIYRLPCWMGYQAMDAKANVRNSEQKHAFWLFLPDGFQPDSGFNWDRTRYPDGFGLQFTQNEAVTIFSD